MAPFGAARTGMDWEGARGLECDNVLCVHRVWVMQMSMFSECDDVLCVHGVWVMQVSMFSWSVTMCSVFMGLGYTGEHVLLECDDVLCVHRVWVIQVSMFSWSVTTCSVFTGFGLCR